MKTTQNPLSRIGNFTSKCIKAFVSGIPSDKIFMNPKSRRYLHSKKSSFPHEGEKHIYPRYLRKAFGNRQDKRRIEMA